MSNRNFDSRVIIQRLQNKNYARNLYQQNVDGQRLINNPQNSDGNSSRYVTFVPGAQTDYYRTLAGTTTINQGGTFGIPVISQPTDPIPPPSIPGSMYFDSAIVPNGTHVSYPNDSSLAIGTQSFTIEWYQYFISSEIESYPRLFSIGSFSQGANIAVSYESSFIFWNNNSTIYVGSQPPYNTWTHIAIVGTSNNGIRFYQNGVEIYFAETAYNFTDTTTPLMIGNESVPSQIAGFKGNITNFRWVVGQAVYTTTFTPPTIPLANIPGTQLLLAVSSELGVVRDSSSANRTPTNTGVIYSPELPIMPFVSAPSAPVITSITPGNAMLTVNFTPPVSDGGSPIANYEYSTDLGVTYFPSRITTSPMIISLLSDQSGPLVNGTTYNIQIRAVNSVGAGILSNTVSATPVGFPPSPPILTGISSKTDTSFTITFTQDVPVGSASIINYKYSLNGESFINLSPVDITSPVTISGLLPNTVYNIILRSISTNSESTDSNSLTDTTLSAPEYVRFTTPGTTTWTVPAGVTSVQYLIQAGGGGSGATYSDIEVIGTVPFQSTSPGVGQYWINDANGIITDTNYGLLFKGNSAYVATKPARVIAPQIIIPNGSRFNYDRWYDVEMVYYIGFNGAGAGKPITSNVAFTPYTSALHNNVSGGSGGAAAGQLLFQSGTTVYDVIPGQTYTVVVGNGGTAGIATLTTETNGGKGGDSSFDTVIAEGGSGGANSRQTTKIVDGFNNGANGGQIAQDIRGGFGGDGQDLNSGRFSGVILGGNGGSGRGLNFDGTGFVQYGGGGKGGDAGIVNANATPINLGRGAAGTGATLNSFANGIVGGSGIVILKYTPIPTTVPEPPTALSGVGVNQQIFVSFTPGNNGGSAITNYQYSTDNGVSYRVLDPVDASSPITITKRSSDGTDLINGETYTVRLKAVNANGPSVESSSISVTPVFATVPFQPTGLSGVGGNQTVYVLFTQVSDGGSPITNYEYAIDDGSFIAFNPAQTFSPVAITTLNGITRLTNGISYNVTLKAVNAVGSSIASGAVAVTPTVNSLNGTNLLIELDASNSSSYSGTAAWTNLRSGGLYSATLRNAPPFDNVDKYFTFNGTNQMAEIGVVPNTPASVVSPINPTISNIFTVQIWARINTSSTNFNNFDGLISKQFAQVGGYDGYSLAVLTNGALSVDVNGNATFGYSSPANVFNNGWALYTLVVTFTGQNNTYVSTRLVASAVRNASSIFFNNATIQFPRGIRELDANFCPADVGAFYLYDRRVSQEDIIRNYDATKARYGL